MESWTCDCGNKYPLKQWNHGYCANCGRVIGIKPKKIEKVEPQYQPQAEPMIDDENCVHDSIDGRCGKCGADVPNGRVYDTGDISVTVVDDEEYRDFDQIRRVLRGFNDLDPALQSRLDIASDIPKHEDILTSDVPRTKYNWKSHFAWLRGGLQMALSLTIFFGVAMPFLWIWLISMWLILIGNSAIRAFTGATLHNFRETKKFYEPKNKVKIPLDNILPTDAFEQLLEGTDLEYNEKYRGTKNAVANFYRDNGGGYEIKSFEDSDKISVTITDIFNGESAFGFAVYSRMSGGSAIVTRKEFKSGSALATSIFTKYGVMIANCHENCSPINGHHIVDHLKTYMKKVDDRSIEILDEYFRFSDEEDWRIPTFNVDDYVDLNKAERILFRNAKKKVTLLE